MEHTRRWRRVLPTLGLLMAVSGCRLPGMAGPVPDSVAAARRYWQQGAAAIERGEWEVAEMHLAEAVKTNPVDVEARRHYATALRHGGDLSAAREHLEEAIRLAPDDAALRAGLAEVLLEQGETELAREQAEMALDLDPRLAAAWAVRGKVMRAIGDLRQALADFQRGLGHAPSDREMLHAVASLYFQMNQPQRTLAVVHQLLDTYLVEEQPMELVHFEGLAYHALGRYDEAAASLAEAADRGVGNPDLFFHLAEAELLAGRPERAMLAAREALLRDPAHQASRELLDHLEIAGQSPAMRR